MKTKVDRIRGGKLATPRQLFDAAGMCPERPWTSDQIVGPHIVSADAATAAADLPIPVEPIHPHLVHQHIWNIDIDAAALAHHATGSRLRFRSNAFLADPQLQLDGGCRLTLHVHIDHRRGHRVAIVPPQWPGHGLLFRTRVRQTCGRLLSLASRTAHGCWTPDGRRTVPHLRLNRAATHVELRHSAIWRTRPMSVYALSRLMRTMAPKRTWSRSALVQPAVLADAVLRPPPLAQRPWNGDVRTLWYAKHQWQAPLGDTGVVGEFRLFVELFEYAAGDGRPQLRIVVGHQGRFNMDGGVVELAAEQSNSDDDDGDDAASDGITQAVTQLHVELRTADGHRMRCDVRADSRTFGQVFAADPAIARRLQDEVHIAASPSSSPSTFASVSVRFAAPALVHCAAEADNYALSANETECHDYLLDLNDRNDCVGRDDYLEVVVNNANGRMAGGLVTVRSALAVQSLVFANEFRMLAWLDDSFPCDCREWWEARGGANAADATDAAGASATRADAVDVARRPVVSENYDDSDEDSSSTCSSESDDDSVVELGRQQPTTRTSGNDSGNSSDEQPPNADADDVDADEDNNSDDFDDTASFHDDTEPLAPITRVTVPHIAAINVRVWSDFEYIASENHLDKEDADEPPRTRQHLVDLLNLSLSLGAWRPAQTAATWLCEHVSDWAAEGEWTRCMLERLPRVWAEWRLARLQAAAVVAPLPWRDPFWGVAEPWLLQEAADRLEHRRRLLVDGLLPPEHVLAMTLCNRGRSQYRNQRDVYVAMWRGAAGTANCWLYSRTTRTRYAIDKTVLRMRMPRAVQWLRASVRPADGGAAPQRKRQRGVFDVTAWRLGDREMRRLLGHLYTAEPPQEGDDVAALRAVAQHFKLQHLQRDCALAQVAECRPGAETAADARWQRLSDRRARELAQWRPSAASLAHMETVEAEVWAVRAAELAELTRASGMEESERFELLSQRKREMKVEFVEYFRLNDESTVGDD